MLPIGWRTSFHWRVSYNVKSSLSFVPGLCRETGKFVWPSQSVQVHTESPGSPIDKEYHFSPPDFEDVGKKSRWKTNLNYRTAKIDLCILAKTNHHQQFKKKNQNINFYFLFIIYSLFYFWAIYVDQVAAELSIILAQSLRPVDYRCAPTHLTSTLCLPEVPQLVSVSNLPHL